MDAKRPKSRFFLNCDTCFVDQKRLFCLSNYPFMKNVPFYEMSCLQNVLIPNLSFKQTDLLIKEGENLNFAQLNN